VIVVQMGIDGSGASGKAKRLGASLDAASATKLQGTQYNSRFTLSTINQSAIIHISR